MATVTDLALLDDLTVESILAQLQQRYRDNQIYTYVGDILIAVNPYTVLPIYQPEVQAKYLRCQRADNDPHIYYLAYNAYEAMLRSKRNQAFVISGESGAGKTESTKFIVNHVIEMCKASNKELENRITRLNPLIEAFGNAKTVMNNNSSRFGKFLELNFDVTGAVTGAEISEYLLEKSRVTMQAPGEQNYHVFYILLAGVAARADQRDTYQLGKPSTHKYVAAEGAPSDDDVLGGTNSDALADLLSTFGSMGFEAADVASMQNALAALLHLGNVEFAADKDDFAVVSGDTAPLDATVQLLKVDRQQFEEALVSTNVQAGGEMVTKRFNPESARETRDSLARALYTRLFGWIISCCNENLAEGGDHGKDLTLGILDIFGFEDFDTNRLEQLCINVTNEQLQNFFADFIFKMEQDEYEAEGIDVSKIEFADNKPTLDVLLGKPHGLLAILNEESRVPQGSDLSYTRKIAKLSTHPSNALTPPTSDRDLHFSVTHYAGDVKYDTSGFLNKNRDALSFDVGTAMRFSEDELVKSLWKARKMSTGSFRTSRQRAEPLTAKRKPPNTVALQFTNSLDDLMAKIRASTPHFVRCIKPNAAKAPSQFEAALVEKQLRYSGVLETVRIRKQGFSVREVLSDFVGRYASIAFAASATVEPTQESCDKIMEAVGITDYTFGKQKIFMKYNHPEQLTAALRKQREAQQLVQRACLGLICRVRYRHLLEQKAIQTAHVASLLGFAEDGCVTVRAAVSKLIDLDHEAAEKRKWLKAIQKKKEKAEKERLKKEREAEKKRLDEEAKRLKAEAKAFKATKTRGKVVNGNQVFVRNEKLTMRVGSLDSHWEKKMDPKSGRFYFKNHKTRETTWIDPRTAKTRKKDARDCADDELPYGWDEGEQNGETYYIDHINQKTHWLHPRLLLDEMRKDYVGKEEDVQARADVIRAVIKQHRDKRRRLEDLKAEAGDAEMKSIEQRIQAMDIIIDNELEHLQHIVSENQELRANIRQLNNAFGKAAFAEEHDGHANAFAEDDVADLYALERDQSQQSLPEPLNTATREQLGAPRDSSDPFS
eukprot:m.32698 g.32698  ORF g.32698 m.32698 type:complete len:1058 (-) comp4913_c0_seq1:120-3293(-)